MADRLTDEQLAALEALEKAATPANEIEVTRYGHGGGRAFSRVDGEARNLVADFYNESDREAWIAARNALPSMLAEVRALRECERALRDLEASGTRVLDVNHHSRQSGWTAVQDLAESLVRSRAALAGVRAGEPKE